MKNLIQQNSAMHVILYLVKRNHTINLYNLNNYNQLYEQV